MTTKSKSSSVVGQASSKNSNKVISKKQIYADRDAGVIFIQEEIRHEYSN